MHLYLARSEGDSPGQYALLACELVSQSMSKSVLNIQTPDEVETVFYEAFMHGDAEVMAALWADGDVVCIHPGSGIISGHEAVVRSWRHILEKSQPADIRYTVTRKSQSGDIAVHIVTEEMLDNGVTTALVIATNVYQRFSHGWKLIEHHGSLMQQPIRERTLQ